MLNPELFLLTTNQPIVFGCDIKGNLYGANGGEFPYIACTSPANCLQPWIIASYCSLGVGNASGVEAYLHRNDTYWIP